MAAKQCHTPPGFASLPEDCMVAVVRNLLDAAAPSELKNAVSSCKALYRAWHLCKSVRGVDKLAEGNSKELVAWVVHHYTAGHTMPRMQRLGLGADHPAIAALASCEEFRTRISR